MKFNRIENFILLFILYSASLLWCTMIRGVDSYSSNRFPFRSGLFIINTTNALDIRQVAGERKKKRVRMRGTGCAYFAPYTIRSGPWFRYTRRPVPGCIFLSGESASLIGCRVQVEQESGQVCVRRRPAHKPCCRVIVNRHCHPAVTSGIVGPTDDSLVLLWFPPLILGVLQITVRENDYFASFPGSCKRYWDERRNQKAREECDRSVTRMTRMIIEQWARSLCTVRFFLRELSCRELHFLCRAFSPCGTHVLERISHGKELMSRSTEVNGRINESS